MSLLLSNKYFDVDIYIMASTAINLLTKAGPKALKLGKGKFSPARIKQLAQSDAGRKILKHVNQNIDIDALINQASGIAGNLMNKDKIIAMALAEMLFANEERIREGAHILKQFGIKLIKLSDMIIKKNVTDRETLERLIETELKKINLGSLKSSEKPEAEEELPSKRRKTSEGTTKSQSPTGKRKRSGTSKDTKRGGYKMYRLTNI